MIILVVNLHSCVTYSHVGSWYAMSENEPSLSAKVPFILWEAHLQSFFMGLMFFIAGYYAHGSLSRRGGASFARERLFRLGMPSLLFMLVIHPFILLGLNPWRHDFGPAPAYYLSFLTSGHWLGSSGPLWFAVALLIFCLALAALPKAAVKLSADKPSQTPSSGHLCLFAVALGLVTFLVRMVAPIGESVLNMQLCYFVQYVAFFSVGVGAARQGWLKGLVASEQARWGGWIALVGGPISLLVLLVQGKNGGLQAFAGGWHWQAFLFAMWEQVIGVGLSLGLLAFFARYLNKDGPFLRWIADRSFAVYVLHAPVLVALMMLFRSIPQNPYLLALLLTAAGLIPPVIYSRMLPGEFPD